MIDPILYKDMTPEEQARADLEECWAEAEAGPPSVWERVLRDDLLAAHEPSPRLRALRARMVSIHDRLHQLTEEGGLLEPESLTVWERLLRDGHLA